MSGQVKTELRAEQNTWCQWAIGGFKGLIDLMDRYVTNHDPLNEAQIAALDRHIGELQAVSDKAKARLRIVPSFHDVSNTDDC